MIVGKGPAVHTTLWSDLPLLPGDRITDVIDLGEDPDTGERLYLACWSDEPMDRSVKARSGPAHDQGVGACTLQVIDPAGLSLLAS